MSKLWMQLISV